MLSHFVASQGYYKMCTSFPTTGACDSPLFSQKLYDASDYTKLLWDVKLYRFWTIWYIFIILAIWNTWSILIDYQLTVNDLKRIRLDPEQTVAAIHLQECMRDG